MEMYDLQLASAVGAPAMERCLLRHIENTLGLPVWMPVDMQLYLQLDQAVSHACRHIYAVWMPVDMQLYLQLDQAVSHACRHIYAVWMPVDMQLYLQLDQAVLQSYMHAHTCMHRWASRWTAFTQPSSASP